MHVHRKHVHWLFGLGLSLVVVAQSTFAQDEPSDDGSPAIREDREYSATFISDTDVEPPLPVDIAEHGMVPSHGARAPLEDAPSPGTLPGGEYGGNTFPRGEYGGHIASGGTCGCTSGGACSCENCGCGSGGGCDSCGSGDCGCDSGCDDSACAIECDDCRRGDCSAAATA